MDTLTDAPLGHGATGRAAVRPLTLTGALAALLVIATAWGLLADVPYRAPEGVRATLPAALRGQDHTDAPALGEAALWTVIAGVSVGWLVAGIRRMRPVGEPWLRPGLWPVDEPTGQRT